MDVLWAMKIFGEANLLQCILFAGCVDLGEQAKEKRCPFSMPCDTSAISLSLKTINEIWTAPLYSVRRLESVLTTKTFHIDLWDTVSLWHSQNLDQDQDLKKKYRNMAKDLMDWLYVCVSCEVRKTNQSRREMSEHLDAESYGHLWEGRWWEE
jgi:hypothetical protein